MARHACSARARAGRHLSPSHDPRWLLGAGSPLLTVVLAAGATALLAAALAVTALHVSTRVVVSGSMSGTYEPGALVLAREVPVSAVGVGDVIVFTPPGSATPYVHRVTSLHGDPAHPVVTTRGDANSAPDAWRAQLSGDAVPRAFASVPHVGGALLALQSRHLRSLLLALLGTVLAVSGSRMILGSPGPRRTFPRPADQQAVFPTWSPSCPSTPPHPTAAGPAPSSRPPSAWAPSPSPQPACTPA